MRFPILVTLAVATLAMMGESAPAAAQLCATPPGVELPAHARDWHQRMELEGPRRGFRPRVEAARQARLARPAGSLARTSAMAVTGHFDIPVLMAKFSNSGADPFPPLDLEQELFGGGSWSNTLSDFYAETSHGNISVGGTVYPWASLLLPDSTYAGNSNGLGGDSMVWNFLTESLDANDGGIDFGIYDNDGPDGIPNSGDDDGYVDFVAFVHPETGGECSGGANGNLWSHRFRIGGWPSSAGQPYITNDAAAGGGFIVVDDYVLQPGLSCGGGQMIEIGVFSHEFGHAFGLPDLYDVDGNGSGGAGAAIVGNWCLMASGNWNRPDSPAHMSAWCKQELGWATVVELDWQSTPLVLDPVETSGIIYRMTVEEDRWLRRDDCVIAGAWSMAAGLTAGASSLRGHVSPKGYGNLWEEVVAHDFYYDGNGSVTLEFDYQVDSESAFDFGRVLFESGGVESQIAIYDGSASGHATLDLSPYLGAGPQDYSIRFRFNSDGAYSNQDGNYAAACAAFTVDNISVQGGSETHFADFESHRNGWYPIHGAPGDGHSEYWLAENRQKIGYDLWLKGEGLLISHVDEELARVQGGNSGGSSDQAARGITIEEADNGNDLLTIGGGRGSAGDVWPGTLNNTEFSAAGSPFPLGHSGIPTPISISGISLSGQQVLATFRGGYFPPTLTSVSPDSAGSNDGNLVVDLGGVTGLRPGATLRLIRSGEADIVGTIRWEDYDRGSVELVLSSAATGLRDVVLENPDGQTVFLPGAFDIQGGAPTNNPGLPAMAALGQNYPNPFNPTTTIRFDLPQEQSIRLSIRDARGRVVRELASGSHAAGFHSLNWDGRDDQGLNVASGLYFYSLEAGDFQERRKMLLLK